MLSGEYFNDLMNLRWQAYLIFAFIGLIAYYISNKAKSLPFRIIAVYIAIEMLLKDYKKDIFFSDNIFVAIGIIAPHIKYFIYLAIKLYYDLKMMFANAYYFLITIYYKILKFFNWIVSVYKALKIFFETKRFKQARDEYKEENPYEESHYRYEEAHNTQDEKIDDEFTRYFSKDPYVVLGVSVNDSFSEMKKIYRKLVREFHPDMNPQRVELCTEITKHINNAYDILKKTHM